MSILYEPFKDDDAIAAALDRYWEEAYLALYAENDEEPTNRQIEDRALELAKKEARRG
jgi:hypothetical protein